jgi:hypothetical protein
MPGYAFSNASMIGCAWLWSYGQAQVTEPSDFAFAYSALSADDPLAVAATLALPPPPAAALELELPLDPQAAATRHAVRPAASPNDRLTLRFIGPMPSFNLH